MVFLLCSPPPLPRRDPISAGRSIPAFVVFLLCSPPPSPRRDPIPTANLYRSFHPCHCRLPPLLSIPPPVILSRRHAEIHLMQALLGPLGFAFWAPTNVVRYFAEWFCGRPLRWQFRPLCWRFSGRPLHWRFRPLRWRFCGRPLCWRLHRFRRLLDVGTRLRDLLVMGMSSSESNKSWVAAYGFVAAFHPRSVASFRSLLHKMPVWSQPMMD